MKWAALAAAVAVSAAVGLFTTIFFAFAGNPAIAQAGCGPQQSAGTPVANVNTDFGPVRPAGGGVFVGGKWHYSEQNGPKWTPAQIAAKAEQYGLPGKTFAEIARGESNYHPHIVQHDPGDGNVGFGFFQFTPNAWGGPGNATYDKLVALGGQKGLEDVEKQFQLARWMYIAAGHSISPWHGTDYVTDWSTPPARPMAGDLSGGPITAAMSACQPTDLGGDAKLVGLPANASEWLVKLPGTDAVCDKRIIADLLMILERYKMKPGDCWACPTCGHASDGEHPLGLGVDLYPDEAKGGTWEDVDAAAAWAEPSQNDPRKPFRWVGYNGDSNHGKYNHLHLSWDHSQAAPNTPAEKVWVLRPS